MPESKVVSVVRAHRLAMSAHEVETMREMAVRWMGVERAIDGNIAALANEMIRRTQAGEVITPSMIRAADRYQILKAQTEREILKYNKDAAAIISDGQVTALEQGLQTAQDAIVSSAGFNASFNKINVGAVDAMVGYAGDGSPLVNLLNDSVSAGAADSIVQSLIDGIGQGLGAEQVARNIAGDLGGNFDRSLVIARTEINRSYRSASTEQYRQSGVVDGFMRLVARDEACLACIALDGERFASPDEMDDHPNGRCTCVPIIAGMDAPEWETAQEWLANQSDEKQLEIMGPARFEMFKSGTPISAFGEKRQSDIWGASPKIVPIGDLNAGTVSEGVTTAAQKNEIFDKSFSKNETITSFEKQIYSQKFESAALYKDGIQLFKKDGSEHAVNFTNKEMKLMKGATLTHNHPGGGNFSFDDVGIMSQTGLSEIRAVSNEYIYIYRNGIGIIDEDDLYKYWNLSIDEAKNKFEKVTIESSGIEAYKNYVSEYNHFQRGRFAELIGFEYERIPR
jgi:hypothetical protein